MRYVLLHLIVQYILGNEQMFESFIDLDQLNIRNLLNILVNKRNEVDSEVMNLITHDLQISTHE